MASFPEYVHNLFREASTGLSVDEMCAAYKIMGKMLDLHKRKEENDPKEVGNYQMDVGDTNEVPEIPVTSDTASLAVNTEKETNYEEINDRQLQQENSTWPTIEVYFTASIYKVLFPTSEVDAINWKLHMWTDDLFFNCGTKNVVTDSLEIGQQVLNSGGTVFYVGKPKMCPPDAHLVFGKSPMHKGREIIKHFTGRKKILFGARVNTTVRVNARKVIEEANKQSCPIPDVNFPISENSSLSISNSVDDTQFLNVQSVNNVVVDPIVPIVPVVSVKQEVVEPIHEPTSTTQESKPSINKVKQEVVL